MGGKGKREEEKKKIKGNDGAWYGVLALIRGQERKLWLSLMLARRLEIPHRWN